MNSYIGNQFRKGTTTYSVYFDNNNLKIDISCHNLSFKNFWGGEWLSYFTVDLSSNRAEGNIKVNNHYFEQGNIQFKLAKDFEGAILNNADA